MANDAGGSVSYGVSSRELLEEWGLGSNLGNYNIRKIRLSLKWFLGLGLSYVSVEGLGLMFASYLLRNEKTS